MDNIINFCENRNIYMPSEEMIIKLHEICNKVYEYPDYKNIIVNDSVSKYFNVSVENLLITNGSLEGINLVINTLNLRSCGLFVPTFWGYEDALDRWGYNIKKIKINNMQYSINDIDNLSKKCNLIIICNPNNPTLSFISKQDLLSIIDGNPSCHFLVDETMLIFDENFDDKTLSRDVVNRKNLSVAISFSKFLGIAGLRTGVIFSNKKNIENIKEKCIPYSLGVIQQEVIPVALSNKEFLNSTRLLIKDNRDILCNNLNNTGCKVVNENTNFIMTNLPVGIDSYSISKYLYENGMEVRNVKEAYPELDGNWLRISISTPENNLKLVRSIKKYVEKDKK